ncbi:MAG: acyltransferase family protein [Planctomycetota bacterium]
MTAVEPFSPSVYAHTLPIPNSVLTARAISSTRYESLDFWRGAACLMLVVFHGSFYAEAAFELHDRSTWTAGSLAIRVIRLLWMGVPIFFVISGYCIAASVDSLRRKPRAIGSFFTRRFRRIYPPLWIACLLAIAFWWLASLSPVLVEQCKQRPDLSNMPWTAWIGNFLAAESWLPTVTGRESSEYLMRNTWTLCYEEQFYVIAGLALAIWPRGFFTLCGMVTLGTLVARHAGRADLVRVDGWFFDGHWLLFACGVSAHVALNHRSTLKTACMIMLLAVGIVYGICDRSMVETRAEKHLCDYIVTACGFALAIIASRHWDARFAALTVLRPIVACGKMSYSIYLTHFPVVVCASCYLGWLGVTHDALVAFVVIPAITMATLPAAWVFHRCVERRFMNSPSDGPQPYVDVGIR